MKKIKTRKHHRASQLIALAATGLPLASQATENQVAPLPTISVTANSEAEYKADKVSSPKFTQALVDTTQTVSVIKAEVLQEQTASTLTEALRNVPGVGTFAIGENGRMNTGDAISMRGFDTANSIFVDGIRDLGNVTRDIFNTDQIEVFKGPAGPDNGRTAASGAINLTSKQPLAEDFNKASIGAGSDNYLRATADINKQINDTTAIRLNVMGENADGINRDHIENKKWGIAPSLALGLDTDTRLYLNYLHIEQDNIIDGGVSTAGLDGFNADNIASLADYPSVREYLNQHTVDRSTFYGSKSDFDDVTADMVTARVEHDISDHSKLTSISRWGKLSHQYLATIPTSITYDADNDNILVNRSGNNSDSVNKILTNQTNFTTSFNTGIFQHDLSTGIELTQEEMNTNGWDATAQATSLYDPDTNLATELTRNPGYTKGQLDTYSIYAFDTLHLSSQWAVNAGVRLDYYTLESSGRFNTAGRGQPEVWEFLEGKNSDALFNWKTGILFKPVESGSIYANYALQQQPPGTIAGGDGLSNSNAFLASTSSSSNNNLDMDPQEISTVELGTKWDLLDEHLLLSGAIFHTELSNEIESDPVLTDVYYQNGKKTVQGVELSAVGNITDNWQVTAGYTHQKTEIKNVDQAVGSGNTSADGSDEIPFTPSNAFSLWSTYKTDTWSVGGGSRYMGEMKKSSSSNLAGPSEIPDYWVFDAMASYQLSSNMNLQFNVNNIFDEEYIASMNRGGWRYIPGAERNYRVTFNFDF